MAKTFKKIAFAAAVALSCAMTPAVAQTVEESILAQLSEQGFEQFDVRRTLLGRIRIVARGNGLIRELVFNPVTGEILRDYWRDDDGDTVTPRLVSPYAAQNDDDDDDDRDEDDEDDDDDEDGEDDDDDEDDDDEDDEDDD